MGISRSYDQDGTSYTGKTTSLYWIRALHVSTSRNIRRGIYIYIYFVSPQNNSAGNVLTSLFSNASVSSFWAHDRKHFMCVCCHHAYALITGLYASPIKQRHGLWVIGSNLNPLLVTRKRKKIHFCFVSFHVVLPAVWAKALIKY